MWIVGLLEDDTYRGLTLEQAKEEIPRLLEEGARFVMHNAAFDLAVLRCHGIHIPAGRYDDTMVMSHALCPSTRDYHKLEVIGGRLAFPKDDYRAALIEDGLLSIDAPKGAEFALGLTDLMYTYNEQDCRVTQRAWDRLVKMLLEDSMLSAAYMSSYIHSVELVIQLNQGVCIDRTKLIEYLAECIYQQRLLLIEIHKQYPKAPDMQWDSTVEKFIPKHYPVRWVELNPNSIYHRIWLLDQLKFKFTEKGKSGLPKTGMEFLEAARHDNPLIDTLCRYYELGSSISQADQIIRVMEGGKIRAQWSAANTRTHRFTSSNPNCQNIGSAERNPLNKPLRESFIAKLDHQLICLDFSKIELVMVASMLEQAGDPRIANTIRLGEDIHQHNADLWGCSRPDAKNGIFCSVYGGSAKRLSVTIGKDRRFAKRILDNIAHTYPVLQAITDAAHQEVAQYRNPKVYDVHTESWVTYGVVHDLFGGRYIYSDIRSEDEGLAKRAGRQAFNVKCQGSVGYLIVRLFSEALKSITAAGARCVLQVHDELVIECPNRSVDWLVEQIQTVFNRDDLLPVPIRIGIGVGENWHIAKSKG